MEFSQKFIDKCSQANCRSCGHHVLKPVLDLGRMPLSDGFLTTNQLNLPEEKYPLELVFCENCALVQILETVPPATLFCDDYPYYSSFSDHLLKHSRDNVLSLISDRQLDSNSFVVELASNDGYLLKNYVEKGVPCLGIDPAEGPAKAAIENNVPTMCSFFTKKLALKLANEQKKADVIHANNVLAHVEDTNGFVEGIRALLKNDGVAVIEVPYVRDLIDHREFDTIYHEHLCYFSVTSLDNLFRRHKLYLNDIKKLAIHGGSLRLFVQRHENVSDAVQDMLEDEQTVGITHYQYYQDFSDRVEHIKSTMKQMLTDLKKKGKRIAAYGAAAKGTIMLNALEADSHLVEFVVDRNVHKQGKYVPGARILIDDPKRLLEEMPDYVIILPWNFKDEILFQQQEYRTRGGKFIIPVPEPLIL